jgi:hypothetical protein
MNLIEVYADVKFLAIEKMKANFTVLAENISESKQPCQQSMQMCRF